MRAVEAQLVEEREELFGYRAHRRPGQPERRGLAVAGQVHGDDGAMRREQAQDSAPRLPPVPHSVQQHQRRAGPLALVGEAHRGGYAPSR